MTIALAAMKRTFVYKNTSTWPDAPTHEVSRGHIKVIKHFNNTYYLWRFGLPPDCNSYREQNSGCCYHTSRHTHMHTEEESLVSVISDGIVQMCIYFFTLTISTAYLTATVTIRPDLELMLCDKLWIPDFCPQNECRALKFNWWHMQAPSLQCGYTDTNGCSLFLLHEVVPNLTSVSIVLHSLHSVHS